jgi:hypothetical protein
MCVCVCVCVCVGRCRCPDTVRRAIQLRYADAHMRLEEATHTLELERRRLSSVSSSATLATSLSPLVPRARGASPLPTSYATS